MESIPGTIFNQIMQYATENQQRLKWAVRLEAASHGFVWLLNNHFWTSVYCIDVRFGSLPLRPEEEDQMTINGDCYQTINDRALLGLKNRGIRFCRIEYMRCSGLPNGLTDYIPSVTAIRICAYQHHEPEVLRLIEENGENINEAYIHYNKTLPMKKEFTLAFSKLSSLKTLFLRLFANSHTSEEVQIREHFIAQLGTVKPRCLQFRSVLMDAQVKTADVDTALFAALQSPEIRCLHLTNLNNWIDRWLSKPTLRNRAQIDHLCVIGGDAEWSDPGYTEQPNYYAQSWHSLSDLRRIFPKLQYACIGVRFQNYFDVEFDALLMDYFQNNEQIASIYLSVCLVHRLDDYSLSRFDDTLTKLKRMGASVSFLHINRTDAKMTISLERKNVQCETFICYDPTIICDKFLDGTVDNYDFEIDYNRYLPSLKDFSCVCQEHYVIIRTPLIQKDEENAFSERMRKKSFGGFANTCLCVNNSKIQ